MQDILAQSVRKTGSEIEMRKCTLFVGELMVFAKAGTGKTKEVQATISDANGVEMKVQEYHVCFRLLDRGRREERTHK